MNQDSPFPPMLPPSTELGALLFAALPCLQEVYQPLASFAFHLTELSRLKQLPPIPTVLPPKNMGALIADKEGMLRSLSFYGNLFRMPFLSMLASLLQGMQFYNTYKDLLPGLFSAVGDGSNSPFDSMTTLFSGLSGIGGITPDVFSALGNLSPDFLASFASGFQNVSTAGTTASNLSGTNKADTVPNKAGMTSSDTPADAQANAPDASTHLQTSATDISATAQINAPDASAHLQTSTTDIPTAAQINRSDTPAATEVQQDFPTTSLSEAQQAYTNVSPAEAQQAYTNFSPAGTQQNTSDTLYDSLYAFMTPEQKEIYLRLMNTD